MRSVGILNGMAQIKNMSDLMGEQFLLTTGAGVPIGAGTITGVGTGDATQQACNAWGGTGLLKGTKGSIAFKMLPGTQGCGDDQGNVFSLSGYAVVTKATGKLAKAKGKLKVTGTYDRGAGTFTAKFTGKLKR